MNLSNMNNSFNLSSKLILVSGATSGIGLEVCKQIFYSGGKFIGFGRNLDLLSAFIEENYINDSYAINFDLADLSNIEKFIYNIPKIDGFVHSAGIVQNNPIQFFNFELYESIRKINLDSALFFVHQLLSQKKFNKPSSIVFLSSISGLLGMKGNTLYGITKASLNIMTKSLSNELASKSIRVNSIAPGMVNTRITQEAINFLSEEVINTDKKKYPLGYGDPIDVALPIIFLLSQASKWITGQIITVDGGRTSVL